MPKLCIFLPGFQYSCFKVKVLSSLKSKASFVAPTFLIEFRSVNHDYWHAPSVDWGLLVTPRYSWGMLLRVFGVLETIRHGKNQGKTQGCNSLGSRRRQGTATLPGRVKWIHRLLFKRILQGFCRLNQLAIYRPGTLVSIYMQGISESHKAEATMVKVLVSRIVIYFYWQIALARFISLDFYQLKIYLPSRNLSYYV